MSAAGRLQVQSRGYTQIRSEVCVPLGACGTRLLMEPVNSEANTEANRLTNSGRKSIDPAMTLSDHEPDPERKVIEQESQDIALRMLGGLPQQDREVLVRFFLHEQTTEDICRVLDLTETHFRLIISRAKARYRELSRRRFSSRSGAGISKETKDNSAVSSSTGAGKLSNKVAQEPAGVNQGGHADVAVLAHAHETFGSQEKANHWLRRPNHVFQGRTPLEVLESDPQAVEIELTRIDYGVYI